MPSNDPEKTFVKYSVLNLSRPKTFLSSMERNSQKTGEAYTTALFHFNKFALQKYPRYNCETILKPLANNKINVYELLEGFVSYFDTLGLAPRSVSLYVTAIRSYLAYFDIDIIPSKFRRKVRMPKIYREDEEALDATDIRKLLLSCNNRRLKTLLLILSSGGMRITEALAIRNMDLDFETIPTKVHIRKEYSKTRVGRDVYISDEATFYLRQWLDWKYKNPERERKFSQDDLVFTVYQTGDPRSLYIKVWVEFERLLKILDMNERKEGGVNRRRKITFHSLRRFVKTVISNQIGQDYSEWFLGHSKSPYWTLKEEQRREIYTSKCMKYLTFLDYSTLEATGRSIEAKLFEKDKEIIDLKELRMFDKEAIANLSDTVMSMQKDIEVLKSTQIAKHDNHGLSSTRN